MNFIYLFNESIDLINQQHLVLFLVNKRFCPNMQNHDNLPWFFFLFLRHLPQVALPLKIVLAKKQPNSICNNKVQLANCYNFDQKKQIFFRGIVSTHLCSLAYRCSLIFIQFGVTMNLFVTQFASFQVITCKKRQKAIN